MRVGVGLLAFTVFATGGVYVLYKHLLGNVKHTDVFGQIRDGSPSKSVTAGKSINILIVGSDDRTQGDNKQYQASPGQEQQTQHESDTAMVAHLSGDGQHAVFVSIPRDSMVDMPSCPLPNGKQTTAKLRMFNEAFNLGGPTCAVKTVEKLTNVHIDHYIAVDFSGFKRMTEALDGVPVCLKRDLKDRWAGLDLKAGPQRVKGDQALALVRARKQIGGGSDLERIQRQHKFMSAVVREATDTGLLLRPDKLVPFLDAATKSLTVDDELARGNNMMKIAQRFKNIKPENVTFTTVPVGPYPKDSNRVVWVDPATALWQAIRDDAPLPGTPGAPTPSPSPSAPALIVAPSKINVKVLNGTATQGFARTAADELAKAGFNITAVETSPTKVTTTTIRHSSSKADSARTLAAAAPVGARLVEDSSLGSTITLIIGPDWTGIRDLPAISGSSSPSPSHSPAPVKVVDATDDTCI
jgi:LCP family protein required for cell wall assembly